VPRARTSSPRSRTPARRGRGLRAIVFRPLGGGALTAQATGRATRHPLAGGQITRDPKPFEQDLARARELATALGLDGAELSRLAYRFALDHPGITTVLGGFSDEAQLEEMASIADAPGLTEEERSRVLGVWRSNFDAQQEVR